MSTVKDFAFSSTPQLLFGAGKASLLPTVLGSFGDKVLLITGARSFLSSTYGASLSEQLRTRRMRVATYAIDREPSPSMVDTAVKTFSSYKAACVVAVGGGSVLDAGKAISAMLPLNEPVRDYLEVIGTKAAHPGVKVPFVAVPTTSGTGSEATKNAVLSETGPNGFKRSLRHNNFVPDFAIVDPQLSITCTPETTAASGMDAFTQLLESFLSTSANPITDALASEGLTRVSRSLQEAYLRGENLEARTDMALAAYLSGVTLANAGLGLVHGLASPLGALFDIPHGIVCSALMAPANRVTVRKLRSEKTNAEALTKYARAGKTFAGKKGGSDDYYIDFLLDRIAQWTVELKIPALSKYGVGRESFGKIVAQGGNKNNPAVLTDEEIFEVLELAL